MQVKHPGWLVQLTTELDRIPTWLIRIFAIAMSVLLFAQLIDRAQSEPLPTRFTVKVEGQGPDVIMIPGLASSAEVWRPQADKLKTRYRVHLVQVAGFAGTPAGANANGPILVPLVDELAAYIRANRLNRPALIGHSLGGLIELMLADKYPNLVGRMMIVDSLPFFGMLMGPQATVESVTPMAAQTRDRVLAGGQAAYAAQEPQVMSRLVKSTGPGAQAAIKAATDSDHSVVARFMYEDFVTDMRPKLAGIKTPVVVLYAYDASMGIPQTVMDGLYQGAYAALPAKKLVRIDGSYHFIQIDQPEAFDREVQVFLSGN